MAGVTTTRTLLFILMLGASCSRPTKKGYIGQGGGSNTNPQVYVPASAGPYGGPGHGAPYWPTYPQPGYVGTYPVGPIMPNTGPAAAIDVDWLKASPHPHSDVEGSPHPSSMARAVDPRAMGAGGFKPHGRSHGANTMADPTGLGSVYQPGELSHMKNTFEHGHYDTETESEGLSRQLPGVFIPRMYLPVACHYGWCQRPLPALVPRLQMPVQHRYVPQWHSYSG